MDPVFRSLPHKILLPASSCAIASNWVPPRAYEVIELGELDDEGIIIVFEEWLCLQSSCEDRLEVPLCLFLISH